MTEVDLPHNLSTVEQIARQHGYSPHQVRYVLRTRSTIEHIGRIGQIKLYGLCEVGQILRILDRIQVGRMPMAAEHFT